MGRGGVEEFVLEFDEPGIDPDGVDGALERTGPQRPGRQSMVRPLPRPVMFWSALAVLLVVAGIILAPPPPGPSWGVSPGWSSAPVQRWTVPLAAPGEQIWMSVEEDHVLVFGEHRIDAYDRAEGTHDWFVTGLRACTIADGLPVCLSGLGADARVAVVDDDGAVREVAYPGAVSATLHRGDLVVLTESGGTDGDYELTVLAGLDPTEPRWSAGVEAFAVPTGYGSADVRLWDDLLLVSTGALHRAATGERIDGSWSGFYPERPLVSWDEGRTRAILPGTDEVLDLPGNGWPGDIDDGSSPRVSLVESPGSGTSAAVTWDGEVLWEAPFGFPVARLGDAILLSSTDSVGRDVRTGEVLWSIPDAVQCACRGDAGGLLLYVYRHGADGRLADIRLIGLRIADGAVLWELPLAVDAMMADADEALAVLVDDRLTLYSRT